MLDKSYTNSAQISDAEEYDSKIFRVVVFSQEMKDHNTEHMTITIWFCLDSNYKGVLVAEHEHGNITLDSHDTFRLGEGSLGEGIQRQPPVTVTMEANNSNAWNPDTYQKVIYGLILHQFYCGVKFR
ncbi:hypothetical protein BSL78_19794 [Apostichopus japonicus]|uniref:Uncharacterized protein n=1 Tax=Stichopus japonicus TaxID=307972 RepID=A0A2G8K5W3_STIJA|nr:hypothetical protein BSL78_19794 [Apostichopus japonicus]